MSGDSSQPVATETRKLAAIMFTDIVGFSRQMSGDEARIKTVGDTFLVDFLSVVHAVQCAQSIQSQFRTHNTGKEKVEQIHVRIGIHLGDIVQRNGDVFGNGVNIASRLQTLAEAAEVMRLNPRFSLAAWGQRLPYKDREKLAQHLATWRKTGLK